MCLNGHNRRIGRLVVIAAQTGFFGGMIVEDYTVIGGQLGVGDRARIESKRQVTLRSCREFAGRSASECVFCEWPLPVLTHLVFVM